jgi:hypothetical protein
VGLLEQVKRKTPLFSGWIGGAISSANSGLGEFACGVAVDNFAYKLLVKISKVPPDAK